MLNPSRIEETYKEFVTNLPEWAHDGIVDIDLKFLHDAGILNSMGEEVEDDADDLTQFFDVIHGEDKATLYNEQFIVWIVPKIENGQPITYVMIALNHAEKAVLEVLFTTKGVYNTPRHVLIVLQHFLLDMLETEATLTSIEKNQ